MCACALGGLSAWAATVTASLDRGTILTGESATLQIRIEGGNPQAVPNFPAMQNLTIQYAGAGSERRFINGAFSSAVILSYSVTAAQPGSYTIPPIRINVDGTTYTTQQLGLVVSKEDPNSGTAPAFVRLQATKTNVYIGELIPIEIKVYGLVIEELSQPTLKSDGFTIGAQAPAIRGREQVGNAIYNVYSFQLTVAAAKAGTLQLGPAEAPMLIRIPTQRGRRTGDIFDEFFGGYQRRQVTGTSDPLMIRVKPLPTENVPPSFNGALGDFQMTVSAAPTNVSVGDPITLQFKIFGRGSLDTIKLPDFGWKDFTFYPPNSTTTNSDGLGAAGAKYFDQVIIPNRAGLTMIPPIAFSFFHPEKNAYQTIQRPAIPISVRATGQGLAQPTVVAEQGVSPQKENAASDIVHIKASIGHLAQLGPPVAVRPWFFIVELLPLALWGGAVAWRRREEKLANDPRLRRRREVMRHVNESLPQLRRYASERQNDAFIATAFRLLQEQLGERLDLPAAAITEAVVDEKLPKLGASKELTQSLHELFQACNQARYAGASVAGMEALIPKVESALDQIQKLPDHAGGAR